MMTQLKRSLIALPLMLALASLGLAQLKTLKPGWNLFSKEQDIQMGKEAEAQVYKQVPVIRNTEIDNYLADLGGRLAKSPRAGGFPFSFHLVYDKNINAFALPGGPVFVNTGLITAAENEAQLAGVLAHEMSHVALRHGTNQLSKQRFVQIPAMLAGAVLGNNMLAQLGINVAAGSVLLKMSRTDEAQADYNGAQIMADAGYNPIEMARFFEKLQSQTGNPGMVAQFLSDHPNPGNRVQAVEKEIQDMPQRSYNANTGKFSHIRDVVAHLAPPGNFKDSHAGEPPEARPSAKLQNYKAQSFSISYPDNWQVLGDKDANSVTIAPGAGVVQGANGQSAIGYGIIQSYYFPKGDTIQLRQDTQDLIRQLQQQNQQMRIVENSRDITVGGQKGIITILHSTSPYKGEQEIDQLVTVPRPEGLFYLVLIAPESEQKYVKNVFQNVIDSVRF